MNPLVSIICPTYNEEKYISTCIESILLQDYPQEKMEVLFIDGMSVDNTQEIINSYCVKHNNIKLLQNPYKVVPHALNIGLKEATGKVIIRLDAHSVYPQNYVSVLVKYLFELDADNVGALWNTKPADETSKCRAIALASSHKFGVGASLHKIGVKEIVETDTVPFGCYRREVFDRIGFFDEDLVRNQDDEFNARLVNSGGKIYLIPELVIDYTARSSVQKMVKMYYQYGLFKPLVNKKLGLPATFRQFFPMLFFAGLIIGAVLSFFSKYILCIYLAILALYLLLSLFFSLKTAFKEKEIGLIFFLPIVFFLIHISYGVGYWKGIFNIVFKRPFNVKSNR